MTFQQYCELVSADAENGTMLEYNAYFIASGLDEVVTCTVTMCVIHELQSVNIAYNDCEIGCCVVLDEGIEFFLFLKVGVLIFNTCKSIAVSHIHSTAECFTERIFASFSGIYVCNSDDDMF